MTTSRRKQHYYFKFKYEEYMMLTCLLHPVQRDMLMFIAMRRQSLLKVGLYLCDKELDSLRQQFFRNMRPEAWLKKLQPMIDRKLVIKSECPDRHYVYTTVLNENWEEDLRRADEKAEANAKAKASKENAQAVQTTEESRIAKYNKLNNFSKELKSDKDKDVL